MLPLRVRPREEENRGQIKSEDFASVASDIRPALARDDSKDREREQKGTHGRYRLRFLR